MIVDDPFLTLPIATLRLAMLRMTASSSVSAGCLGAPFQSRGEKSKLEAFFPARSIKSADGRQGRGYTGLEDLPGSACPRDRKVSAGKDGQGISIKRKWPSTDASFQRT